MSILAHIHTFNDEDVIERSLRAVRNQTRAPDEIIIVDNHSTDSTLERNFPEGVTVIRHDSNLGTNGSVNSGMRYALEQGYDWIWLFDADSAPRPDALQRLLDFYDRLPEADRTKTYRLSSLCVDMANDQECHGVIFTPTGFKPAEAQTTGEPYQCTVTIWSGSLYRVEAIRDVGLPSLDYVLDWGEFAYGYQGMCKGWKAYMVPSSLVDHNIRGVNSVQITSHKVGPLRFRLVEMPPIRYYYLIRNNLFFWLHEFRGRNLRQILRMLPDWRWMPAFMIKFALLGRWKDFAVGLRAMRDGIMGRVHERF